MASEEHVRTWFLHVSSNILTFYRASDFKIFLDIRMQRDLPYYHPPPKEDLRLATSCDRLVMEPEASSGIPCRVEYICDIAFSASLLSPFVASGGG